MMSLSSLPVTVVFLDASNIHCAFAVSLSSFSLNIDLKCRPSLFHDNCRIHCFFPLEVIWQVYDWYQEDTEKDEPLERNHEHIALGKILSLNKNFVPFVEYPHKCVSKGISLKQNSDSNFQSKNYAEINSDETDGPEKLFFSYSA